MPDRKHPSSPNNAASNTASRKPDSLLVETLKTLALSFVLALGTRTSIAEARFVPTGSMQPTIEIDDHLLIDKVSYRFGAPQRGDIIVFAPPLALEQQNMRDALVKRVIGLPGEQIEIKNGQVFVDGQALSENYTKEAADYTLQSTQIPPDQYLVLGDNRNNSNDSHVWGFVPREKIIGRVLVRYWPLNRVGTIEPLPSYREP